MEVGSSLPSESSIALAWYIEDSQGDDAVGEGCALGDQLAIWLDFCCWCCCVGITWLGWSPPRLLCCCVSIDAGRSYSEVTSVVEDWSEWVSPATAAAASASALPLLLLLAATEGFLYAARSALFFTEVFVDRAIIRSLRLKLLLSCDDVSVSNTTAFDLGDAAGVVDVLIADGDNDIEEDKRDDATLFLIFWRLFRSSDWTVPFPVDIPVDILLPTEFMDEQLSPCPASSPLLLSLSWVLLAQLRCRRERWRRTCRELFTIAALFLLFLSICMVRFSPTGRGPAVGCLLPTSNKGRM